MMTLFLGAYLTMWTVLAALDVGKPMATGTFDWYLPFLIFGAFAVPAALGYMAGREDSESC